jgi:hypothetical protein
MIPIMQMFSRRMTCALVLFGILVGAVRAHASESATTWTPGTGTWTQTDHWSTGLPTIFKNAIISGTTTLSIPPGTFTAADLEVGNRPGDQTRVELNGGQLLIRQDSLRIGEYTGSQGTFVLNSGQLHCAMDVFVGGVTATTGRMNQATLRLNGGTFLGLSLTVGEGLGAQSLVEIHGSSITAIHALNAVYFFASADPGGTPGRSTLSFTLDEHGVTPITIQSRWRGLEIAHDPQSACRLQIALSAIPPREDIPLIVAHVPIKGTFNDLAEGAPIAATYQNHTYHWLLTYHGGADHHDLVLLNRSDYPPDAPVTHLRPLPAIPTPAWYDHPVYPLAIETGTPAFPEAQGYGAFSAGGRGGQILFVDNLNDDGPGSLRAALQTPGPRIITFRAGGIIPLQSPLLIENPFLTFDAQNAPSPGIMLQRHGIEVRTHDVILRHFRIRIGDQDVRTDDHNLRYAAGDGEYGLYFTEGSQNCIADHLSLSWSTNKILSTTKMSDRITIQWCILSESLNLDGHGYASIAGGNRVSWHHNLFAHNNSRNARFQGAVDADFRNNVIYDWGEKSAYGEFDRLNFVANYLKPGPSTTQHPQLFHDGTEVVAPRSLFLADNVLEGNAPVTTNNWRGTGFYFDRATLAAPPPFPAPPITTESAPAAYEDVLHNAGATLPHRDTVDQRIVDEVRHGTGKIIQSIQDAGGWPDFPAPVSSTTRP